MNYRLLLNTVRHLRMTQVWHQVKYRLRKPRYMVLSLDSSFKIQVSGFKTEPIPRYPSLKDDVFSFLNLEHRFSSWDYIDHGMLWAYNQNYFDWLNQEGMTAEDGCKWIDKFIKEVSGERLEVSDENIGTPLTATRYTQNSMAMDPYPIALRSINWIKFFCRFPECATKERLDVLYSQVRLLEKKLEYHLLANHLLEDAYALYIAGTYFGDERLLKEATRLLIEQLKEQILPDGAHYEQSPMYHCILLDRLLDCINIGLAVSGERLEQDAAAGLTANCYSLTELTSYAERMLGHLESIVWSDGSIPLQNDSAYGIAPTPEQLFDYARRLDICWEAIPMKECGYRKLQQGQLEVIVDVGNITATYQPGHTHADSLNYELRVGGVPFVVDTGISTYNKNERRQLERSTIAHNCVSVKGKNSSEVWGGFRVGRRCHTDITDVTDNIIVASHDGFGKACKRRFEIMEGGFMVEDWYDGEAVSYVHLAEGADVNRLSVSGEGLLDVCIEPWQYSTEYNKYHEGNVMMIKFRGHVRLTVLGNSLVSPLN